MKPKASPFIHNPKTNISTIIVVNDNTLTVLAYSSLMELLKSEVYATKEIQSVFTKELEDEEWGLFFDAKKSDINDPKFRKLYQIASSPIKDDIDLLKKEILEHINMA